MQKFNFSYNKENDDLFLYSSKSKSKGCVELGDLILDYNTKRELVGVQMIHASKLLNEYMNNENINNITELLSNLKDCKVDIKVKSNLLIIKLYLLSAQRMISPILSVPSVREPSPALACS